MNTNSAIKHPTPTHKQAETSASPQLVPEHSIAPTAYGGLQVVPQPTPEQRPRASRVALDWLEVQDVTTTGYRVGVFMVKKARYATEADTRRKVKAWEVFTYWKQSKIAAAMGCSESQVWRGIKSLRDAGLAVRRRDSKVASYVFPQGQPQGQPQGHAQGHAQVPLIGMNQRIEPKNRTRERKGREEDRNVKTPPYSPYAKIKCPKCKRQWSASTGTLCSVCHMDVRDLEAEMKQNAANEQARERHEEAERLSREAWKTVAKDKAEADQADPTKAKAERRDLLRAFENSKADWAGRADD